MTRHSRPVSRGRGGMPPPAKSECLLHYFLYEIIFLALVMFFYLTNTVKTKVVVASQ